MKKKMMMTAIGIIAVTGVLFTACSRPTDTTEGSTAASVEEQEISTSTEEEQIPAEESVSAEPESIASVSDETEEMELTGTDEAIQETEADAETGEQVIAWNPDWAYADYSQIHSGTAVLYHASGPDRKDFTVAVNAGHGTSGGESVKTLCHPDGSPKVIGGSTSAGATEASAVSAGMTFDDGTPEATATLSLALLVKDALLSDGYDVLMLRESDDVQLDNVARAVMANQYADCHISFHYDSTESDKGAFYIGVPDAGGYRSMEPVATYWQQHEALGESLISGLRDNDIPVFGDGRMAIDMTQTSYSTIPSVDLEVGDKTSDHSEEAQEKIARAIVDGLAYFQ